MKKDNQISMQQQRFIIIRINNGENFQNSIPMKLWGIKTVNKIGRRTNQNIFRLQKDDIILFVKEGGVVNYIASFVETKERQLGPLIATSYSNQEIGWNNPQPNGEDNWDTEIYYDNLYKVDNLNIKLNFCSCPKQGNAVFVEEGFLNCAIRQEYENIKKYCECKKI